MPHRTVVYTGQSIEVYEGNTLRAVWPNSVLKANPGLLDATLQWLMGIGDIDQNTAAREVRL